MYVRVTKKLLIMLFEINTTTKDLFNQVEGELLKKAPANSLSINFIADGVVRPEAARDQSAG